MPTTFTIKQVPDDLADCLRRRAEDNRRSLQKELLSIMEGAVEWMEIPVAKSALRVAEPPARSYLPSPVRARARARTGEGARLTLDQLWQRARKLGAANRSESAAIVRRDRDARHGR